MLSAFLLGMSKTDLLKLNLYESTLLFMNPNSFLQPYLRVLKVAVANKFSGKQVQPGDCYELSNEIKRDTEKSISETTLKRFFGFANSHHQPSTYTLTALSEYCGYRSWQDFMKYVEESTVSGSTSKEWNIVKLSTYKSTHFNTSTIRRKAKIDPENLIYRTWIDDFFDDFEKSDSNTSLIVGPAHSGKTLATMQWVEKKLNKSKNDIVLYLDKLSLIQSAVYGFNPNKWLANALGMENESEIENFFEHYKAIESGKMHVIIDGFNKIFASERLFFLIIENLIDIIQYFTKYTWLRFTLIMRTDVYHKFRKSYHKNWDHSNFFIKPELEFTGQLKFNLAELTQLCSQSDLTGFVDDIHTNPQTSLLKHPKLAQLLIQYKKLGINIERQLNELPYHLIFDVLKDDSIHSVLTKESPGNVYRLFRAFHEGIKDYNIESPIQIQRKDKIAYSGMFHELLGKGVAILNSKQDNKPTYTFESPVVESFIISYYTILSNDIRTYNQYIEKLESENIESKICVSATKWFVYFKIVENDYSFLEANKTKLFHYVDRKELMEFIFNSFDHHYAHKSDPNQKKEALMALMKSEWYRFLINEALLDDPTWWNISTQIQHYGISPLHKIEITFKIAKVSLFKWDLLGFMNEVENLQAEPSEGETWIESPSGLIINPIGCLSAIFQYGKYGQINAPLIEKSTHFNQKQRKPEKILKSDLIHFDITLYIILFITGDRQKASIFLKNLMKKSLEKRPETEKEIYALIAELTGFLTGGTKKMSKSKFDQLQSRLKSCNTACNYMETIFMGLILHLALISQETALKSYQERLIQMISASDLFGFRLLKNYYLSTYFKTRIESSNQPSCQNTTSIHSVNNAQSGR